MGIPSVLTRILETKAAEVAAGKSRISRAALDARGVECPATRGFAAALLGAASRGPAVIAECKKASPSKGVIREDFDPVAIARDYAAHGASALSVLTDGPYFQGSLDYLRAVREAVQIPVLCKDFIIDASQVYEARDADAGSRLQDASPYSCATVRAR